MTMETTFRVILISGFLTLVANTSKSQEVSIISPCSELTAELDTFFISPFPDDYWNREEDIRFYIQYKLKNVSNRRLLIRHILDSGRDLTHINDSLVSYTSFFTNYGIPRYTLPEHLYRRNGDVTIKPYIILAKKQTKKHKKFDAKFIKWNKRYKTEMNCNVSWIPCEPGEMISLHIILGLGRREYDYLHQIREKNPNLEISKLTFRVIYYASECTNRTECYLDMKSDLINKEFGLTK